MRQRRRYSAEEFDRAWAVAYSRLRVERERRDEAAANANAARFRQELVDRAVAYAAAHGVDWNEACRKVGLRAGS